MSTADFKPIPRKAGAASGSAAEKRWRPFLPYGLILLAAILLPFLLNGYWVLIATRAAIYWVLVSGLNLVVGFGGQLAIGYVALLTIGAYTASILVADLGISPYLGLGLAGVSGLVFGVVIGLPALRLRNFYFAMTTLGFATITTEVAMAWRNVTGGGTGLSAPFMPGVVGSQWGYYFFCVGLAAICTWLSYNVAHSRYGRALLAIRDVEVAGEASGISRPRTLLLVFLLSGAFAGVAGGLFATLQSYITPDAFTFDLSVLFFIAILIGGRGSIIGPLLGTILLTVLPEVAAPLVAWSTFLYAALLLLIVLTMPGGIADLLDFNNRKPLEHDRAIVPDPTLLPALLKPEGGEHSRREDIELVDVHLSFGGVRAVNGLSLTIERGKVHGLIGPNGSGKTTTLNIISGFHRPDSGEVTVGHRRIDREASIMRAAAGIARTFQTPRLIGEASILQNVMLGGYVIGRSNFAEAFLHLPKHNAEEHALRERARQALDAVGLSKLADVRADRVQHSELRFVEIARAVTMRPSFILLDEPAAGLSGEEMRHLAALIREISRNGVGVLLVEHHADLIFEVSDDVTVLNQGRLLTSGAPDEIRGHKEVVDAYLGG